MKKNCISTYIDGNHLSNISREVMLLKCPCSICNVLLAKTINTFSTRLQLSPDFASLPPLRKKLIISSVRCLIFPASATFSPLHQSFSPFIISLIDPSIRMTVPIFFSFFFAESWSKNRNRIPLRKNSYYLKYIFLNHDSKIFFNKLKYCLFKEKWNINTHLKKNFSKSF